MYQKLVELYSQIFPVQKEVVKFMKEELKSTKIIDMGCGTGELAYLLSEEGFEVLGLDLEENMVDLAIKSHKPNDKLNFSVGSISEKLFNDNTYDSVYCIGNTLVHLENEKELLSTFENWNRLLKADGKLIIQILNYDYILENKIRYLPIIEREGFIFEREYKFKENKIEFITRLKIKNEEELEGSVELTPFSKAEIEFGLVKAGFEIEGIYANFNKTVYTGNHLPLIFVARKI